MATWTSTSEPKQVYETLLKTTTYGLPLWKPEPSSSANPVMVGDVGYIHNGEFYRLFNIANKNEAFKNAISDEPTSQEDGLPSVITSKGLVYEEKKPKEQSSTSPTTYTFTTSKPKGAILIITSKLMRTGITSNHKSAWKQHMDSQLSSWPEPAVCGRRDLLLVHTRFMASEWVMVVFDTKSSQPSKVFVNISAAADDKDQRVTVTVNHNASKLLSFVRRGRDIPFTLSQKDNPSSSTLPSHCVFLHAFRPKGSGGVVRWNTEDTSAPPESALSMIRRTFSRKTEEDESGDDSRGKGDGNEKDEEHGTDNANSDDADKTTGKNQVDGDKPHQEHMTTNVGTSDSA